MEMALNVITAGAVRTIGVECPFLPFSPQLAERIRAGEVLSAENPEELSRFKGSLIEFQSVALKTWKGASQPPEICDAVEFLIRHTGEKLDSQRGSEVGPRPL